MGGLIKWRLRAQEFVPRRVYGSFAEVGKVVVMATAGAAAKGFLLRGCHCTELQHLLDPVAELTGFVMLRLEERLSLGDVLDIVQDVNSNLGGERNEFDGKPTERGEETLRDLAVAEELHGSIPHGRGLGDDHENLAKELAVGKGLDSGVGQVAQEGEGVGEDECRGDVNPNCLPKSINTRLLGYDGLYAGTRRLL